MTDEDGPPDGLDEPNEFPTEDELPDDVPSIDFDDVFEIDDSEVDGGLNDFVHAEWLAQRLDTRERRNLVSDIVGHPSSAPSLEELVHMNPDMSSETVESVLEELVNVDVVRVLDAGDVGIEDPPTEFYALTSEAEWGVSAANRYPREAWRREYSSVEKTPRIQRLEQLSRPEQ